VWTEAVSGKKKLRIQKYPDTCGRGTKSEHISKTLNSGELEKERKKKNTQVMCQTKSLLNMCLCKNHNLLVSVEIG